VTCSPNTENCMNPDANADIASMVIRSQDDGDSVVLPNACKGHIVELDGGVRIRCFSVLTRQPHTVPPESWVVIQLPAALPAVEDMDDVLADRVILDHVTRGFIGDNAIQVISGEDGNINALRLLPPGSGPAQEQWEAQAHKMLAD